jgi:hypothetical protein
MLFPLYSLALITQHLAGACSLKEGIGRLMASRVALIAVLLLVTADPALASWWIARASDGKCVVVDIEPTGNDKSVTKVGKDVYQTSDQAEADVKRLCEEPKPAQQPEK